MTYSILCYSGFPESCLLWGRISLLSLILLSPSPAWAVEGDRKPLPPLAKALVDTHAVFDGNRIRNDLENNGMFVSHRITGHSGMEWPKGAGTYINFASGIWLGGKVQGELRLSAAEYASEFLPGPHGTDPGDPDYRIYKINRTDLSVVTRSGDVERWPVDQGAPWVDTNGDGIYNVNDGDRPGLHGDQMLWYVMHDEADRGDSLFGAPPLQVEAQITIWGYDRPGLFGDMMFVKGLIINQGQDAIDAAYVGLWDDPDLGFAGDDFVGCDTTLDLGFCYNDGPDVNYGAAPPALGYQLLQGPIVPSPGDTAFAFGRFIPGHKNLTMTACLRLIKSTRATATDPNDAQEAYYLLSGLDNWGSPIVNIETGESTNFTVPDDPSDNTGRGDGVWVDGDDYASGDRRFLMSSGPFTMAPGDSQEVVFAIIIARGLDPLDSVTELKLVARVLKDSDHSTFPELYPPWLAPRVAATPLRETVILNWDDGVNASETFQVTDFIDRLPIPVAFDTTWTTVVIPVIDTLSTDPLALDTTYSWEQAIVAIDTIFRGEPTTFAFQGYNIYQLETATGQGAIARLATFDLIDGVTEIVDRVPLPAAGQIVEMIVQFGSDSGVRRSIAIDSDALRGGIPLKLNRAYYFAVTAYSYNPYGIPRTLESALQVLTVRPQIAGTVAGNEDVQAGVTTVAAIHSAGSSDGSVNIRVIDPLAVTGDDYEVTFRWNPNSSAVVWDLTNTTTGELLVAGSTIQNGLDVETGETVGEDASPIAEGIQVIISGPALGFKSFQVVANAAGPIDPPEGAAADFQGFPALRPTESQQVGGGHWFFHAGDSSGGTVRSYEAFLSTAMRGSNFNRLVPYDWEMRFTAEGSWAVRAFTDGLVVSVPFELWNVGIATYDDPSDDYRVIPWFWELAAFGLNDLDDFVYQVEANDHATSGGRNDPYTDWIYWRIPADNSAGTAGYDAFVAALDFTTDPPNEGTYDYASPEVIARSVLINWNGGDVEDPTWPANVNQLVPEEGTVFRLISTKPNGLEDVFTFSTDSLKATTLAYDPERINVWPNPYFAYNPEERLPQQRIVMFTHLPEEGEATIRIFNLAGHLVRILRHPGGSQFATWDLRNLDARLVGSGMYIVHIETEYGDRVLKLGVVQPAE